jgi:ubiquinone/menaquinone biosynthesis C-methylase UbiE
VPAGRVAGADPSPVMLGQATRRNRAAIAAGRVELHLAAAERLPFADECFDKALALHSLPHWSDTDGGLREVQRVLKPGGALLIALRGERGTATVEAALSASGFLVRRRLAGASDGHRSTLLLATAAR